MSLASPSSPLPSPSSSLSSPWLLPTPTVLAAESSAFHATSTSDQLPAHTTPCISLSAEPSGPPNVVHVVIHTTVTISDYSHFFKDTPITAFQPSYTSLSDGSLVTSAYESNLQVSAGWLVFGGALSVYFARNTYRAIQYTRIVNATKKSLFYMLIVSQAIGVFTVVFYLVADFLPSVNCTT